MSVTPNVLGCRKQRGVSSLVLTGTIAATVGLLGSVWWDQSSTLSPDCLTLSAPRVVVVKHARTLHLFDGEHLVRSYPIDLGRAPVGSKRYRGDCRTPEGRFRVTHKNAASPFHRFVGIDYPNREAVKAGIRRGLLSFGEASDLLRHVVQGGVPDTALGGGIGIHGQRKGEDWTGGCIALSDEHVVELFSVLRVGDSVEILP